MSGCNSSALEAMHLVRVRVRFRARVRARVSALEVMHLLAAAHEDEPRCRKQAGSGYGQLALRRLLSATDDASGCPRLRPASANLPLGRLWPAVGALVRVRVRP